MRAILPGTDDDRDGAAAAVAVFCYGLGSLTSYASRVQTCVLLDLLTLPRLRRVAHVFDPAFSKVGRLSSLSSRTRVADCAAMALVQRSWILQC